MNATVPMTGPAWRRRAPSAPAVLAPRVLFCVAVGLFAVGLVRYVPAGGAPAALAAGLLAAYLLWLLLEVPVTFRRAAAPPAESRTLVAYALGRLAVIGSAALGPMSWTRWSPWLVAPLALFAVGVTVRQVAIRTLGRFYTHHVMRQDGHLIVTTGPYRLIRHPAYAGMLLANLGFVVFFLSVYSAVAMVALTAAVIWRLRREERLLWQLPDYPAFATGRARLVPGLW